MARQIMDSCRNCGECLKACPIDKCISSGDIYRIDPAICTDCLICVPYCKYDAIKIYIPIIEPPIEESET